jgi:hypothetical protein
MTRYLIGALAAAGLLVGSASSRADDSYTNDQIQKGQESLQKGQDQLNNAQQSLDQAKDKTQQDVGAGESGAQSGMADTASPSRSISGTIQDKSGSSLTVLTSDQLQIKLDTGDKTQVLDKSGQKVDTSALKEGDQVSASYRFDGSKNEADKIQVLGAGSAAQPGTPTPSPAPDSNKPDSTRGYNTP